MKTEKCIGKRKRIQWFQVMRSLQSSEVEHLFIEYIGVIYKGTQLSKNRCAYYALKKYYHTTTINELLQKLGISRVL